MTAQHESGHGETRLTGTYWGLVFVRDRGGQTDVSDVNGYLQLTDDGRLSWRVGNGHNGTISIEGDRMSYVGEWTTLARLNGRHADIEAAVTLLLKSRPHWRVDGDELQLYDDAGNQLICQVRSEDQLFRQ
jgi:hypothetical protein